MSLDMLEEGLGKQRTLIGLALQTWLGLVINVIVFPTVFGYRIHIVEKALESALGENYVEYEKRTKRLIPYVI
jgi:protein-S-isoprenylcysteine O-methyltransferase Ste14